MYRQYGQPSVVTGRRFDLTDRGRLPRVGRVAAYLTGLCCPRCGVVFRRYRIRQVMLWVTAIALAGWAVASHGRFFHAFPHVFH